MSDAQKQGGGHVSTWLKSMTRPVQRLDMLWPPALTVISSPLALAYLFAKEHSEVSAAPGWEWKRNTKHETRT